MKIRLIGTVVTAPDFEAQDPGLYPSDIVLEKIEKTVRSQFFDLYPKYAPPTTHTISEVNFDGSLGEKTKISQNNQKVK